VEYAPSCKNSYNYEYNLHTEQRQSRSRGGAVRKPVRQAASHTVALTMACRPGLTALMGCIAVLAALGGTVLDDDQFDKVS
jgi:hypothetical protein